MNKQTQIIIVVVALASLLLIGIFVWPTRYRYDHVNLQGNVLPVRIDRFTGKTEMLDASGWHEPSSPVALPAKQIQELPSDALAKLDVQLKTFPSYVANDKSYLINCKVYNGSEWIVQEVIVDITVKDKGGADIFSRRYRMIPELSPVERKSTNPKPSEVPPYTLSDLDTNFGFTLKEDQNLSYRIVSAKGYK
jgi:hypothetical protein